MHGKVLINPYTPIHVSQTDHKNHTFGGFANVVNRIHRLKVNEEFQFSWCPPIFKLILYDGWRDDVCSSIYLEHFIHNVCAVFAGNSQGLSCASWISPPIDVCL